MKPYLISFFIIVGALLNSSTLAHEEENQYNLSSQQQQKIEDRLQLFFNTVEAYEIERKQRIYTRLQDRIEEIIEKYDDGTPERSILDILDLSVKHITDQDEKGSINDILSHIIYGTDYHTQHEAEIEDNQTIENTSGDTEKEKETVFRADLFTEELNEYDKDILAGSSAGVMSLRVRSSLEPIDTERVEITFNQDIDNIGLRGNLYHDGVLVGEASSSDIRDDTMIFDNMTSLIIGETTSFLQLELLPASIGEDSIGAAKIGVFITEVSLQENRGTITGDRVGNQRYTEDSRAFNIVPVHITASVEGEFEKNRSSAGLRIIADQGDNNDNGNGLSPQLTRIDLQVSAFESAGEVSVFNGSGKLIGSTNVSSSGNISIFLSPDNISSRGEKYELVTNAEAIFILPQDGISYLAGGNIFTTNLGKQIFLGQR